MEFFIYLKTLIFFALLIVCGVVIIRRLTEENRAEIIIPSGTILGIALYIFLINLAAHFFKETPGFYLSLVIEILIAILVKRNFLTKPINFPKGKTRTLVLISLLLWTLFLYKIVSTSALSGDILYHYGLASLFSRGDYPMHTPWQPDYVMSYHYGAAEFLGATRSITNAPYTFIHLLLAFFMLLSWSQILTWSLIKEIPLKFSSLLIISTPALVGLISLGGFIVSWPTGLGPTHFDGNILKWLGQLPTLNSLGYYGTPTVLDMMIVFIHRFLSISFFFCLVSILISPQRGNFLLLTGGIVTLLASVAITDEAVLVTILPAVFLISFFTIFNRSIIKILPLIMASILIISLQGGIITETLFNRHGNSNILIFPKDIRGFQELSLHFFKNLPNHQPFRFLNPGIIVSLLLLVITVFLRVPKKVKYTIWIFFISAITSLIAYYGIVPKILSDNGSRFLGLSYYFSALGIVFYIVNWWFSNTRSLFILRFIIVWILLFSLIPPFFNLFPRQKYHGLFAPKEPEKESFNWVKDNLSVKARIIVLTHPSPFDNPNVALSTQIGAYTPTWGLTPRTEVVWEITPLYIDSYLTLNPSALHSLKIDYLIISNYYLPKLASERMQDLLNRRYFQPVFIDSRQDEVIFKVTPEYLAEGKDLGGTLTELAQIAPKEGTFFIEYVPNISENMFRALRVLLHDRDVYHQIGAAFYNGSIDVKLIIHKTLISNYDYLILGTSTDPKTICNCEAKLLWTGYGNGIKFWKTKQ